MIKISGFVDEVSSNLGTQIAVMKSLGQKYLCPRSVDGKNITSYKYEDFMRDVNPRLVANGIELSSLGSGLGKVKIDDEEGFKRQLNQLDELLKIAQATECKYIRVFSFFMGKNSKTVFAGGKENGAEDYSRCFEEVADKTMQFVKKAEGTGVTLIHENEKGIYGSEVNRVLELYHAINSPSFKLCHDSSNYIQCGYDPLDAWEKTKDYVVYVHGKDNIDGREVPMGIGDGHYQEIIADLKAADYDGFITLEPHTAFYAKLKRIFYVFPLLSLTFPHSLRVYRTIDKAMGVKMFEGVTMQTAYRWQYEGLVKILNEEGVKYE